MSSSSTNCPKLSVAIIVRNAAGELAETLASLHDLADEIIVLDTGSTDETIQVARKSATAVHEHPFNDSFAEARNQCLRHVCGDWVLWLDAGERIAEEEARQLRQFIDTQVDRNHAYMMLVQAPADDKNISGEQLGCVRLVPNHPAIVFEGRLRERMTKSLAENGIKVEGLPYRILRGPRENDPGTKVRRARRNIQLADLEIKEQGPSAHLLNSLGEAHQLLNNNGAAIRFYHKALEQAASESADMLEAYYGLLTSLDNQQDRQPQMSICLKALEVFPLDAQLLCAMGGYLQSHGRLDLAARSYQTAWKHGKTNPNTWHLVQIQEVAAVCYSLTLQLQNQDDEALKVLDEAILAHPTCNRLRRHSIELHVKHGRRDEAISQLNHLPKDTANIEALRSAIRGACLAQQENWISARAYLEAAFEAGCRDVICHRWLSQTLIAIGDLSGAKTVLEQWKSRDPANAEVAEMLSAVMSNIAGSTEADSRQSTESRQIRVDSPTSPSSPPVMPTVGKQSGEVANPPSTH